MLFRSFLASSRSYKDCLALNASFQADIKQMIIETPMPKFIWVAELSNKSLMKRQMAEGLIILDATEANTDNTRPLLIAAYQDIVILNNNDQNGLKKKDLPLQPFIVFSNNLS